MIEVYGIANCDTVKKARTWLSEQGIDFVFHDFKKNAPTEAQIRAWLGDIELNVLLNKRGTTWRKLSSEEQAQAETEAGAIALMLANPSIIKRPVLAKDGKYFCGFQAEQYQEIFA
ncbi:MAG: ArsC family reductase [Neisseria sp.]|nr:ArsC family reductase [Neisseria sp.]